MNDVSGQVEERRAIQGRAVFVWNAGIYLEVNTHYNPEELNQNLQRRENLKSHKELRLLSCSEIALHRAQNICKPDLRYNKRGDENEKGKKEGGGAHVLCAVASPVFPYLDWLAYTVN